MSGSSRPTQYTGMPNQGVPLVNGDGTLSFAWFQFFQAVWSKLFDNSPNSTTLNSVSDGASADLATETARAQAAERGLAAQIAAETAAREGGDAILTAAVAALQTVVTGLQTQIDGLTVEAISATATAGGAGALPATAADYLTVKVGATTYKLPLFNP